MTQEKKPRIAFVIGAGSVKCAAALGIWKVLQRENISIDMLIGSSGGSLYAALMALNYSYADALDYTTNLWTEKIIQKKNWRGLASIIFPRLFKFDEKFSFISDKPALALLNSVFGDKTFADTTTPLYLAATDFSTGEQVALHEGRIVDAMRASISMPYIWPVWKMDGRYLFDGGVSGPMPVDIAIKEGADIILAMGFQGHTPRKLNSIDKYAFQVTELVQNSLYQAHFAFDNSAHHAEIIPIFPEFDRPIELFDTHQIPYIIEQGEKEMEAQMPYIRSVLEELSS